MHLLYCHLFGERFENNRLCCRQFHDTFSTQLEIENVVSCLHALEPGSQVVVYTDCQALCHTILHRRTRLEERDFCSKKGRMLQCKTLYQQLFGFMDTLHITWIKVKGHSAARDKTSPQDILFNLVDSAARKYCRAFHA